MRISTFLIFLFFCQISVAQEVQIDSYSTNVWGQVQLEIQAQADKYYLLTVQHEPDNSYETITSLTMGVDGTLNISEPLGAYPVQNYTVTEHSIANPDDTDGDGIDDLTEYNNMPFNSALNYAEEIDFIDGTTSIDSRETFADLAVVTESVAWAPFLNNQEFVKFGILDFDTDSPRVFFINSNTHFIHANFFSAIGYFGDDDGSGEIVYNPNEILPSGAVGSYSFNYSFGDAKSFEETQRTFELLAASMPFLQNNLKHFIGANSQQSHLNNYAEDFEGSRIDVVFESDFFGDVDFIPFHKAEGFGFFRQMTLEENPGSRDIVLYDALPNSLPRVGGIITSVVQTPLSHVNLRAIQDNVPNAYIRDPLEIEAIASLLNGYVYYKVEDESYTIREATLDEVNAWFDELRPTEAQIPERDLSFTEILPLDDIGFDMATSFGAKCANVATMRNFGMADGTVPNGFGIPFYYYDEFMKYNNFYERVEEMISDPTFINNLEVRIDSLSELRRDIKDADMPLWMLQDLQNMHDSFPEGTRVRCRSSTNNEDLPGFSGAGLYTSKTQHLDEGHISKSIKQVYASMWNFRAYEERDFYRVDQYIAAMGILCHPNFEGEKSNGVGVSIDPIYNTMNTFYLNTQVGESLVTNPDVNSVPEELLLFEDPADGYSVLRESNFVEPGELVMGEEYLDQMRIDLKLIHDEFAILYDVVGAPGFGMDIEYKVTAADQLVIKQARPWVSFWSEIKATFDLSIADVVSPENSSGLGSQELVTVNVANSGLENMSNFDLMLHVDGQLQETVTIDESIPRLTEMEYQFSTPQDFSTVGDYDLMLVVAHPDDGYSKNDTLEYVLSNFYFLESSLALVETAVLCDQDVEIVTTLTNLGKEIVETVEIEVTVNGLAVDTVEYEVLLPYFDSEELTVLVGENFDPGDNEVLLTVLTLNGEADQNAANNVLSFTTDLELTAQLVTLVYNPDNYPQESSWELFESGITDPIASGDYDDEIYVQDFCLTNATCYSLIFYDSIGDGICCGYGIGDIELLDAAGETLGYHMGDFDFQTKFDFCTDGEAIEVISGTNDLIASDGLKAFPNPVSDNLVLQFGEQFQSSDNVNIEVYDNQGRLVDSRFIDLTVGSEELNFSFSKFSSGLYVVRCYDGIQESRVKVVKD